MAGFQISCSARVVPNVLDLVSRLWFLEVPSEHLTRGRLDLLPPLKQVSMECFGSYGCCEIKIEQTLSKR